MPLFNLTLNSKITFKETVYNHPIGSLLIIVTKCFAFAKAAAF